MPRREVRVGFVTIGAIAAVLLLMPFTAAAPVGGLTDAKAGARNEVGRVLPYVQYGHPSLEGVALGLVTPPSGSSPGAGPAVLAPAHGPVSAIINPTSPQPVAQFSGLNETKAHGISGNPSIGVSGSYLVEVAGYSARIESPSGTKLYSTFTLAKFFGFAKTDGSFFSHVVYDPLSHRWLLSTLDVTTNTEYVSISLNSSPLGSYHAFTIRASFGSVNEFMDFTQWGVSATYWAVGIDVWNSTTTAFIGNVVGLFGKAKLDAGTFAPQSFSSGDLSFTPAIAISNNGTGTPAMYGATTIVGASSTTLSVWEFSGSVPHATVVTVSYTIASTGTLPAIPETGTATTLENFGDRVLSASWSVGGGTLWVTYSTACTPSGDSTTRSCIRVDAVSTIINGLLQDQDIAVAGMYLFAESLTAMINGTGYLMAFGDTGALTYPSLAVTGQATSDPFDSYRGPIPVFTGSSYDPTGLAEMATSTQFQRTTQNSAWSVAATAAASGWQTEIVHYTF